MNRADHDPGSRIADKYRDWDAAYVLGSLSPQERHEFELHLADCADCSAAIAELAGIPGILAALPANEALPLAGPTATELPGTVLPGFAAKVRRRRLRNATLAAALAVGSAAAAAGITLAVANPSQSVHIQQAGSPLRFAAVVASPITAAGTVRSVGWGTQLDWTCTYAAAVPAGPSSPAAGPESIPEYGNVPEPGPTAASVAPASRPDGTPAGPSPSITASKPYVLVVTDSAGRETVAASWSAAPGSIVSPTATVGIPLDQIRSVDIRWANTGKTALRADLPAGS
jgi:RNA polymerase sigma-70 factor (ECF subfamily)